MLLSALTCCLLAACSRGPAVAGGSLLGNLEPHQLERLWAGALDWNEYQAQLGERAMPWRRAYEESVLREDFEARAAVLPGMHRILAVVEADCAACVAALPGLARLAERVAGVELRFTGPERTAALFEPQSPRSTLPLAVVLDQDYRTLGCWAAEPGESAGAGARALDEVIGVMEAAGAGERRCP